MTDRQTDISLACDNKVITLLTKMYDKLKIQS